MMQEEGIFIMGKNFTVYMVGGALFGGGGGGVVDNVIFLGVIFFVVC